MADLAASDVTITVEETWITNRKRHSRVKITFGNGALTYPALGVPLPTKDKFGMYRNLDYITLVDRNDAVGLDWKYDRDNNKLRAWQTASVPAHTHSLHFNNADAADAAGTRVNVATDLMGANSGADVEVAGVADTSGHGGVVQAAAVAAGASVELGNVAVAAQTLYGEAIGW